MAKPPKFTPHTWQDQKNLLAEGERRQSEADGLIGAAMLLGLGAMIAAVVGLVVYSIWGILR